MTGSRIRSAFAALAARPRPVSTWLRHLRLRPWPAALLGGAAGLLVGLAMTVTMIGHQVFSQRHQDVTAGAALVLIWTSIGAVGGLTVLSPTSDGASEPPVRQDTRGK